MLGAAKLDFRSGEHFFLTRVEDLRIIGLGRRRRGRRLLRHKANNRLRPPVFPFQPTAGDSRPGTRALASRSAGDGTEESEMPRELIEPNTGDKRYIRRDGEGRFTENQVDVAKSLAADRWTKARTVAKKGDGDRGDQKRSS
jgi:hypothetical protein